MKAVGRAARYGRRYQFLTKVRQSFRKQQQTVVMLARNRDKQPEFPISSDDPDKMPTHQSWQIQVLNHNENTPWSIYSGCTRHYLSAWGCIGLELEPPDMNSMLLVRWALSLILPSVVYLIDLQQEERILNDFRYLFGHDIRLENVLQPLDHGLFS